MEFNWAAIRAKVRELMMANGISGLAVLGLKSLLLLIITSVVSSVVVGIINFPFTFVLGLFGDSLPNSVIFTVTSLVGIVSFFVMLIIECLFMVGICSAAKNFVKTGSLSVLDIFDGFKSDNKVLIIKTMILVILKTCLFTLLCIIPGYIYGFKMLFVPFILSENPDMSPKEIMNLSSEMMNGYKMSYFINGVLFLLPWMILAELLFCCTLFLSIGAGLLYIYGVCAAFYVIRLNNYTGSSNNE